MCYRNEITDLCGVEKGEKMGILVFMFIAGIVAIIINAVTYRKNPKKYTSSMYHFTIRAPLSLAWLGAIGIIFFSRIMFGVYQQGGFRDNPIMWTCVGVFLEGLSLLVLVAPLPRLWDVIIDGNDITIIKLFIIKKHFMIDQIDYCIPKRGEIWVYIKGRKRVGFLVDAMDNGVSNFCKRMKKENIPFKIMVEGRMFPAIRKNGYFVVDETGLSDEDLAFVKKYQD